MIITTSSNIDGYKIIEYFDPIIINKVENIIDVYEWLGYFQNASVARDDMEHLKKKVLNDLRNICKTKNIDAIISFSLDYDEIGGKSGGLLMISAIGTPVKLKKIFSNAELVDAFYSENDPLKKLDYEYELKKRNLDNKLIEKYYKLTQSKEILKLNNDSLIKEFLLTKKPELKKEINYRNINSHEIDNLVEKTLENNENFIESLYQAIQINDFKEIYSLKLEKFPHVNKEKIESEFMKVFNIKRMYGMPKKEFENKISAVINLFS